MATSQIARGYATFVRFLTPTALAALSVELDRERDNLTTDELALLDNVNLALEANVGERDADRLREWYCDHV